ncbi:MAG: MurR/RpiR family transcriptional regulator [Amphritea sp.]|nr:MurR/RpiR family transcriptional regulator [Amphritea sp.]
MNSPIPDASSVLKEISAQYSTLSTQLKKAADYVLEQPVNVALLSIRKSAVEAGVTPSTLTRLAKSVGFDRYDSFRQLFKEAVNARQPGSYFSDRAQYLQERASNNNADNQVFVEFADSAFKNLEQLFQDDIHNKLQDAAHLVIDARKVFSLGFRDTFTCAYHFSYVGNIAFPHIQLIRGYQGTLLSELGEICADDVVVAFCFEPYTTETVQAIKIARDAGAKIIAITDSLRSPIALGSDIVFSLKNDTPHFFPSLTSSITLAEALLAECVSIGSKEMVSNINRFEETLHRLGGYYED